MKTTKISLSPILLFLLVSLSPLLSSGQSWARYDIGNSGGSANFPFEPEWEISYAEDSSMIWVGETSEADIFYGIICIEFSLPFSGEEYTYEELISVAEGYLDYLRSEFNIVSQSGYETGYRMEEYGDVCWVTDSWVDADGDPWLIKTWADGFNMAVMYIYSSPDASLTDKQEYFFNSFRFPE
jgi:hypothetical protein